MKDAQTENTVHAHATLLHQLYDALDRRDAEGMSRCYHEDARFHDIAFHLRGKKPITAMWRMICSGDIRATFEVVHADCHKGIVKLTDVYTFSDTKRKVRNEIESRFEFRDGLIHR